MVAVGNLHNTRILRFLLVLIVVILTIFIYASYSTNSTLSAPPLAHMRAQHLVGGHAAAAAAATGANRTNEFGLGNDELTASKSSKPEVVAAHKRPAQHRLPTIDEDALLDGGAAGASAGEQTLNMVERESVALNAGDELLEEQQYVQSLDSITGNINGNNNNNNSETLAGKQAGSALGQQQQQQQPSEAEILIPTSNLQKFIESADKILKNMTTSSSSSSSPAAAAAPVEQRLDKTADEIHINLLDAGTGGGDPASSAVMRVKAPNEAPNALPAADVAPAKRVLAPKQKAPNPADPSAGILTEHIYESGHMDNEIDAERICPLDGAALKLLILITSAQAHAEARMSIRQTWGHYGTRRDVSMAFILGRTTNETLNDMLSKENYMYGDLIRGNFIDSYNNLTLKTLSSLEWIDKHCVRAQYILKTDDDMFINVPKLLAFLDKHKEKRVIYGRLAGKWKPIRNKKSKYYVSPGQFASSIFPSFTTGPAYVMTGGIVTELYERSLKTVYLKLEDVFTTGIVAQALGIKRVHVNEFLNRRISFNPCNIRKAISVHMIKSNEQFDLWKKLLDQTTKCK